MADKFREGLGALFLEEFARHVLGGEKRISEESSDFESFVEKFRAQCGAIGPTHDHLDDLGDGALAGGCSADKKENTLCSIASEQS